MCKKEKSTIGNERRMMLQSDYAFKFMFGSDNETSKFILKDLLNTILDLSGEDVIIGIEYKNPYNLKEFKVDKMSVLDIKVETDRGEMIDIEMQMTFAEHFHKRSLYYWARLYQSQIKESDKYLDLKNTKCINIMREMCFDDEGELHNEFRVMEVNKGFRLNDDLEIHYIQLPYVNDKIKVQEMDRLTKWLTFIKDIHVPEKQLLIQEIVKEGSVMNMAYNVYEKMNNDDKVREQYEARMKYMIEENTRLYNAEVLGEERGRKEGRIEGRKEGRREVALKLIGLGIADSVVAEASGFTLDEIKKIKK